MNNRLTNDAPTSLQPRFRACGLGSGVPLSNAETDMAIAWLSIHVYA